MIFVSQGTFDCVCRHSWWSRQQWGSCWHPEGRGQACCYVTYSDRAASLNEEFSGPSVHSAEGRKPVQRGLYRLAWHGPLAAFVGQRSASPLPSWARLFVSLRLGRLLWMSTLTSNWPLCWGQLTPQHLSSLAVPLSPVPTAHRQQGGAGMLTQDPSRLCGAPIWPRGAPVCWHRDVQPWESPPEVLLKSRVRKASNRPHPTAPMKARSTQRQDPWLWLFGFPHPFRTGSLSFTYPAFPANPSLWVVFLSFPDGIFSPSFLELGNVCREHDCGDGIKTHTINMFEILFMLCSIMWPTFVQASSPRPSLALPEHRLPLTVGTESRQWMTGRRLLNTHPGTSHSWVSPETHSSFPWLWKVPSDEVTWLVSRLWAEVGQVNTCTLFAWFIFIYFFFLMGKAAAFHS